MLGTASSQWSKAWHEKVEPGEGHHVHRQLPQVRVQLPREPQTGGHARHSEGDQVIEVSVGGVGQLQGPEADVIQRLIVNAESLISVLHQLMHREGGIVGLNHSVGNLEKQTCENRY